MKKVMLNELTGREIRELLVPFGGLTIIELRLSPQFGPQIAWMSMDEK